VLLFVRLSSINKPLQTSVVGLWSNLGKSAFIDVMSPVELTTVAVLPVRVNVTRPSKLAVVKSNASLGNTRSVAVNENEGAIMPTLQ
jgi:hypothetical protein